MNKKLVVLIGLLFLLCGCSATVNLNVSLDAIEEEVSITSLATPTSTKQQIRNSFREFTPAYARDYDILPDTMPDTKESGIDYYERTLKELGDGYNFVFKYKFPLYSYINSTTVKHSFVSSDINNDPDEQTLTLSTDSGGLLLLKEYPNLTDVTVNITSQYKVLESNADSQAGNVYTWNFNSATKKGIYIVYDLKPESSETPGTGGNTSTSPAESEEDDDGVRTVGQKKQKSQIEKIANGNPVLFAVCAMALFFVFVIIITKVTKD